MVDVLLYAIKANTRMAGCAHMQRTLQNARDMQAQDFHCNLICVFVLCPSLCPIPCQYEGSSFVVR